MHAIMYIYIYVCVCVLCAHINILCIHTIIQHKQLYKGYTHNMMACKCVYALAKPVVDGGRSIPDVRLTQYGISRRVCPPASSSRCFSSFPCVRAPSCPEENSRSLYSKYFVPHYSTYDSMQGGLAFSDLPLRMAM